MLTLRRTANITISAAVVAATIIISGMANTAQAGKRERLIGAGIVAGVVGTAIIARESRRSRERAYRRGYNDARYERRRESRWERHVRRCYAAYRSYDERSDTYIGYDGRERRCRK